MPNWSEEGFQCIIDAANRGRNMGKGRHYRRERYAAGQSY